MHGAPWDYLCCVYSTSNSSSEALSEIAIAQIAGSCSSSITAWTRLVKVGRYTDALPRHLGRFQCVSVFEPVGHTSR
jgi:hypothetical protein